MDGLRQRVARVDALATAAERFFEEMPWGGKRKRGRRQLERVAHLVGATIEVVIDPATLVHAAASSYREWRRSMRSPMDVTDVAHEELAALGPAAVADLARRS